MVLKSGVDDDEWKEMKLIIAARLVVNTIGNQFVHTKKKINNPIDSTHLIYISPLPSTLNKIKNALKTSN